MILGLFGRAGNRRAVERMHGEIVAAVRQAPLFADYGVADTFDGRFELLALFSTLVVARLSRLPAPGPALAQELTDILFTGLDDDLREMGVGDLAVPKRIKKLASAVLGRRKAYDEALTKGDAAGLAEALARNVYGEQFQPRDAPVERLGRYVEAVRAELAETPVEIFAKGPLRFPDPARIL